MTEEKKSKAGVMVRVTLPALAIEKIETNTGSSIGDFIKNNIDALANNTEVADIQAGMNKIHKDHGVLIKSLMDIAGCQKENNQLSKELADAITSLKDEERRLIAQLSTSNDEQKRINDNQKVYYSKSIIGLSSIENTERGILNIIRTIDTAMAGQQKLLEAILHKLTAEGF